MNLFSFYIKAIKQKILASARDAKYFSIILDCTPDAGHVEQMTMIIRFVDVISNPENEIAAAASVKGHFLGFVPLKETTGAGFHRKFCKRAVWSIIARCIVSPHGRVRSGRP